MRGRKLRHTAKRKHNVSQAHSQSGLRTGQPRRQQHPSLGKSARGPQTARGMLEGTDGQTDGRMARESCFSHWLTALYMICLARED